MNTKQELNGLFYFKKLLVSFFVNSTMDKITIKGIKYPAELPPVFTDPEKVSVSFFKKGGYYCQSHSLSHLNGFTQNKYHSFDNSSIISDQHKALIDKIINKSISTEKVLKLNSMNNVMVNQNDIDEFIGLVGKNVNTDKLKFYKSPIIHNDVYITNVYTDDEELLKLSVSSDILKDDILFEYDTETEYVYDEVNIKLKPVAIPKLKVNAVVGFGDIFYSKKYISHYYFQDNFHIGMNVGDVKKDKEKDRSHSSSESNSRSSSPSPNAVQTPEDNKDTNKKDNLVSNQYQLI
jgi:hypothetical protein